MMKTEMGRFPRMNAQVCSPGLASSLPRCSFPSQWSVLKYDLPIYLLLSINYFAQFVSFVYHTDTMKTLSVAFTTCEVELESLTQLSLQMYIIFKRADMLPNQTPVDSNRILFCYLLQGKGRGIHNYYK